MGYRMRKEFKELKMPFIIARVKDYYGGKTGQAKLVRNAQVKIANKAKKVAWFDSDDCELFNAGHYNTKGLIKVGNRFAAGYKEISANEKR